MIYTVRNKPKGATCSTCLQSKRIEFMVWVDGLGWTCAAGCQLPAVTVRDKPKGATCAKCLCSRRIAHMVWDNTLRWVCADPVSCAKGSAMRHVSFMRHRVTA